MVLAAARLRARSLAWQPCVAQCGFDVRQPFVARIGVAAVGVDALEAAPGDRLTDESEVARADDEPWPDDAIRPIHQSSPAMPPERFGGVFVKVLARVVDSVGAADDREAFPVRTENSLLYFEFVFHLPVGHRARANNPGDRNIDGEGDLLVDTDALYLGRQAACMAGFGRKENHQQGSASASRLACMRWSIEGLHVGALLDGFASRLIAFLRIAQLSFDIGQPFVARVEVAIR